MKQSLAIPEIRSGSAINASTVGAPSWTESTQSWCGFPWASVHNHISQKICDKKSKVLVQIYDITSPKRTGLHKGTCHWNETISSWTRLIRNAPKIRPERF